MRQLRTTLLLAHLSKIFLTLLHRLYFLPLHLVFWKQAMTPMNTLFLLVDPGRTENKDYHPRGVP